MKKSLLYTLMIIILTMQTYAWDYTIDGDINDWGVTPFSDWIPDSPTADYIVEDYGTGGERPWGGEAWDIEALYFDNNNNYAYFATVTSQAENGRYTTKALALDIDNDETYEYGVRLTNPNKGQICLNPNWKHEFYIRGPTSFTCDDSDSQIMPETADIVWAEAGQYDKGYNNYIIEVRVPITALGNPTDQQLSNAHTAMSCRNDFIELEPFDWDYEVPEFGVIATLGLLGLIGLFVHKKRG